MRGLSHEVFKKIIGYLIETFFFERQIKVIPTGSITQEREGEASAQADESYCFGEAKPIPDLSIKVIFTSGSTAKLKRYQALGVPEVWFWGATCKLCLLTERMPLWGIPSPHHHVTGSRTPPTLVVSNESNGMQGTKARTLVASSRSQRKMKTG